MNASLFQGDVALKLCEIDRFARKIKFDLAIREGVLPFQVHPEELQSKVRDCANRDGLSVITTADSNVILTQALRHIAAKLMWSVMLRTSMRISWPKRFSTWI